MIPPRKFARRRALYILYVERRTHIPAHILMTDIRPLVSRVARALGADATPEKVEAVVAAVLEVNAASSPVAASPSASPDTGERAVVTAYGIDHPGVLRDVTAGVSDAGCNILDVSQKILQGYFTLIMIIDLGGLQGSIAELQKRLSEIGEALGVRVMVQHEELFNAMHRP